MYEYVAKNSFSEPLQKIAILSIVAGENELHISLNDSFFLIY